MASSEKRKARDNEDSESQLAMASENGEERPAKRMKPDYSGDAITVLVGSEEKEFVVHKETLCAHSAFFRAACNREWMGQEKRVPLRHAVPEAFNLYVHWLYTRTVDMTLMPESTSERKKTLSSPRFRDLGKVLILADFLGDEDLNNQVIDLWLCKLDKETRSPAATTFNYIWERTPERSGIRRLLVDIEAASLRPTETERLRNEYPPELPWMLGLKFVQRAGRERPTYEDRCKYHSHKAQESTSSESDKDDESDEEAEGDQNE